MNSADLPEPPSCDLESSIQPYRFADLPEHRPIFADTESYRLADLPDDRPIFDAPAEVVTWSSIMYGRPVGASSLKQIENVMLPHNRPLFSSELVDWETFTVSGDRPIAPSPILLEECPELPNHRPIGSNDIDNPFELMGFID
ncbi:MAG: hypothetical protein KME35_11400 [Aphanocapsa sp. GSE-SYN-MK-11-07L]|jgi:hypothetical protein|nr:hypothetical protein [Aphanocapsa sp. GSE-SYN-MK-11-07L]